jgi:DASS family divalent anion:Na+ symporter
MGHHAKKGVKQHYLQLGILVFGLLLWFTPTPEGLKPEAWHLFAIFITLLYFGTLCRCFDWYACNRGSL